MSEQQVQVPPIPTTIDDPESWDETAQQLAAEAGLPTPITADVLTAMIGSAVPLLFEADATRNMDLLRGTFADPVIAQCQRNAGCLQGDQPTSAVIHLVGAPLVAGHPVLRLHLVIQLQSADPTRTAEAQFWDLEPGAQTVVGQTTCPNCGAPITTGALTCGHCGTDVREVVSVPLVVSRLEMY